MAMTKDELYETFNALLGADVPGDADRHSGSGRYYRVNSYRPSQIASNEEIIDRAVYALAQDDPLERVLAMNLVEMLARRITLPDGTWTVYSTYKDGWSNRPAIWSAHATKKEAQRWAKAWDAHWTKKDAWRPGGTNYATTFGRMDGIAPHYLRRPDADPAECIH